MWDCLPCVLGLSLWLDVNSPQQIPCMSHLLGVMDIWDPPSFFSLLPSPPSHSLWDMIINNEGDLLEDLGPVHRWWCSEHRLSKAESTAPLSLLFHFHFRLIYILISIIITCTTSHHHAYTLMSAWSPHFPHFITMFTIICHSCLYSQTLPPQLCSLYVQPCSSYFHFPFYIFTGPKGLFTYL